MSKKRTSSSGVSGYSDSPSASRGIPETSSLGAKSLDSDSVGGGGGGELDVQRISDEARGQLVDILSCVEGKKDIVIQPQLISLLEHITPFKFLKK